MRVAQSGACGMGGRTGCTAGPGPAAPGSMIGCKSLVGRAGEVFAAGTPDLDWASAPVDVIRIAINDRRGSRRVIRDLRRLGKWRGADDSRDGERLLEKLGHASGAK